MNLRKLKNNKMKLKAQAGNTLMHFENADRQWNYITCSESYEEVHKKCQFSLNNILSGFGFHTN